MAKAPSLYADVAGDLRKIAKAIFQEEDHGIEMTWDEIRGKIAQLAQEAEEISQRRRSEADYGP